MTVRSALPFFLLLLSAVLAPVLGGYVSVDAMPSSPEYPGVLALLNAPEGAAMAHALIALPALLGLALAWAQRSVTPTPPLPLAVACAVLAISLVTSLMQSSFKSSSLLVLVEWMAYLIAMAAGMVLCGRRRGPILILGAVVAGTAWVAAMGVQEYVGMKAHDPTWRIFSSWMNPNALAGLLLIGGFLALSLTATLDRMGAWAAGAAAVVIWFAMLLTQSKGAYLAAGVGLVALVAVALFTKPAGGSLKRGLAVVVPLVAVAVLAFAMRAQPAPTGTAPSGVFGRLSNAQATAEQSGEFRSNLWKGAVALIKERPMGFGIGTYPQESARSGLTTKTVMAHNSFLQLGVEAGILAPLAVIAIVLFALIRVLRHSRSAWSGHHWPRAGLVAAIAASGAHNMVDSDLYYFGLGFLVFLLLGVGLNMAVDGPSPEFTPKGQRWGFAAVAGVVALLMVHLASVEMQKVRFRYAIAAGDAATARGLATSLEGSAGWHGEYWYLRSAVAEPSKALADLEHAAALAPTGRHLRALARSRIAAGDRSGAEAAMNLALVRDPNDLTTMEQLRDLYVALEAYDKATEMARRMIAVESTPYFQVRSLPEVIPMETYRARYWLAQRTEGDERLGELKAALPGYLAFASTTCPLVIRALKAGEQQFAGIGRDKAEATLTEGIAIANLLADYDLGSAEDWRTKAADLAAVRAALTGASAGGSVGNTTSGIP